MASNDGIIWVTWKGRKIPIKPGMKGKFNNKQKEQNDTKKEQNNEQEKLILYHASPYSFDKFDMEMAEKNNQYVNQVKGHYFSDKKDFVSDNFGDYLYEVEVPKDKVVMSGSFWDEDVKDHYVIQNDNDIKILKKYKIDHSVKTNDIYEELEKTKKSVNKMNELEKEWKQNNANIDWDYFESDRKQKNQNIERLTKEYKEASDKKYQEIPIGPSNENKEIKLYHASDYNINKWDDKHFGENSKGGLTGGDGIYFTNENKNMNVYGKNTYETTFNGKLANENEANNLFENYKKETGKWPNDKEKREIMLKNNIDGANFNGDIVVYNVDKLNNPTIMLKTLSDYEQYYINQGYTKVTAFKKAKDIINKRERN